MNTPSTQVNKRYLRSRRASVGFTMIEVLVVIGIMTVLTVGILSLVFERGEKANVGIAKTKLINLKSDVNLFRIDKGYVPTMQQGLLALVKEGYVKSDESLLDPWKNEFIYLAPGRNGESFEIISYGSDGKRGGEGLAGDLSSSEL